MTDRELLELAAKAAEIEYEYCRIEVGGCLLKDKAIWWNPLTDDGDALRLAVKLKMDITFNTTDVIAFPQDGRDGACELIHVADPYAATRRAIVRAVSAIEELSQDGRSPAVNQIF